MRTYPVKLDASDGMPTSLFDPRWREPAVAARVAFTLFCRNDFSGPLAPLTPPPPPPRPESTDARRFPLTLLGEGFKGGSYGELHRHYAFGKYTVNFHAQAVCFGCDHAGRFFLNATVGRFDGPWGNDATLAVTFLAGATRLGTVLWHDHLDPVIDVRVRLVGQDDVLARRFLEIDAAAVAFTARHGKDVPAKAPPPRGPAKLSRARRSTVVMDLARVLGIADAAARTPQLRKLLSGIDPDEARALIQEASPTTDVAAIMAFLESP